jgi:hypothetical protein
MFSTYSSQLQTEEADRMILLSINDGATPLYILDMLTQYYGSSFSLQNNVKVGSIVHVTNNSFDTATIYLGGSQGPVGYCNGDPNTTSFSLAPYTNVLLFCNSNNPSQLNWMLITNL